MKILVPAAFEAGSNLAHAINTVKMAEGFAKLGHDVTIACRQSLEGEAEMDFLSSQYALRVPLRWVQLRLRFFSRQLDPHWDFAMQLLPLLINSRPNFVYSRNYIAPWLSSLLRIPTAAESHAAPDTDSGPFHRFIQGTGHRQFRTLTTISSVLQDGFIAKGVTAEKILVLPDAVDLEVFTPPDTLPQSPFAAGPNVVYTGHLYDYKGIPVILDAAESLPQIRFHLIGGREEDIAQIQKKIVGRGLLNVTLHGHKPRSELPIYLWHADALLLVPSGLHPSARWTSPVKLGEYLVSGRPVISSDIPALRAWLSEEETLFVEPDNPEVLARAIMWLLHNPGKVFEMTANARIMSQDLCYSKRAAKILKHAGM